MSPDYLVYVDEAGDEGFSAGSSGWFVLAAVIVRKSEDLETVKLIDRVRQTIGKKPKAPLHFRTLNHEQRVAWVAEISKAPIQTISILCHKASLSPTSREKFSLYYYSTALLLERISWLCRDDREEHQDTGSVRIVFSNRGNMSYEELRKFLHSLEAASDPVSFDIDWSIIRSERMTLYPTKKRMGLQIADAVASGFYKALEPSRYGYTEDRYVRMLRPVVYSRQGESARYGVTVWPPAAETIPGVSTLGWFGGARSP